MCILRYDENDSTTNYIILHYGLQVYTNWIHEWILSYIFQKSNIALRVGPKEMISTKDLHRYM